MGNETNKMGRVEKEMKISRAFQKIRFENIYENHIVINILR